METNRSTWTQVIFTILIVFGMGYYVLQSQGRVQSVSSSTWQKSQDRQPASIDTITEDNDQEPSVGYLFMQQSQCSDYETQYNVAYEYIRVVLTPCSSKSILSLQISNLTNGYSANIYELPKKHLTSDYISLNEGENILALEQTFQDGSIRTNKIKVTRQEL
jgi:hypothetical protein